MEPLATYVHSSGGKVPEMQHVASANLVKMTLRWPVGQQAQRQRGHGPMATWLPSLLTGRTDHCAARMEVRQ